ncbi:unnamed protein product [Auanema sp. JU1783]|nr:unnamed protein product [Auanema sp. JU1783]
MIGPGCFSVAMAFKQGGLWTAFFLVFFIGTISTLAMQKVVMCSQYLCRITEYEYLDYGNMAAVGFKNSFQIFSKYHNIAKYFVNGCLIAFQIGVASVSYVFVIEHIQQILAYFNVGSHLSTTDLFLLYTIPATLINFVRNIRTVTFICLVGNVFIFLSIAMILQELFTSSWQWKSLPVFTSFDGLVNCAGSLLYSFEGQAMVLPLENKLRHPQDMIGFTGVLSTGMSLVSIVYTYCGFFGYITYGQDVQGSITLNLPDTT